MESQPLRHGHEVALLSMKKNYILELTFNSRFHPVETDNTKITNKDGDDRVVRWCLVNFPVSGLPTNWISVGQGPIALEVGAGRGLVGHYFLTSSIFFSFPLSGRRPDLD